VVVYGQAWLRMAEVFETYGYKAPRHLFSKVCKHSPN